MLLIILPVYFFPILPDSNRQVNTGRIVLAGPVQKV